MNRVLYSYKKSAQQDTKPVLGVSNRPGANLPGDRGLDPFGNYAAASPDEKFALRTQEIKNGRTAMMAVLFYAVFEATTGTPIVQQFAPLFRPFWETPGLLFFGAKYTP